MKKEIKESLFIFFAVFFSKAIIVLGLLTGAVFLPLNDPFTLYYKAIGVILPYYIMVWANLDGLHYLRIATSGYLLNQNSFFPLYPIVISVLANITHVPHLISALFVSYFSFFSSLFIIYKLMVLDKKSRLFNLFLLVILFFPTSLFYGAVYNDALFLLLASTTIYFAREKKIILSSFFGGLACLARLNGLVLIFLIFAEALDLDWKNVTNKKVVKLLSVKKIVKTRAYSIVVLPLAFLSYLIYTNIYFNSWKIIFSSMKVWGQDKVTFPLQVFWRYIKILFIYPHFDLVYIIAWLEFLFVLLYVGLIIYSYKKIRLSYWVFFVISITLPSLTGTFQGMPRYGLHLYPFFLSLTLFLDKRHTLLKLLYFAISITLLFIYTALFTRGFFVA